MSYYSTDRRSSCTKLKPEDAALRVLRLAKGSAYPTVDEVKSAFKRLALQHHPDKQPSEAAAPAGSSEESFRGIHEAYQVALAEAKHQEALGFIQSPSPKKQQPTTQQSTSSPSADRASSRRTTAATPPPNFTSPNSATGSEPRKSSAANVMHCMGSYEQRWAERAEAMKQEANAQWMRRQDKQTRVQAAVPSKPSMEAEVEAATKAAQRVQEHEQRMSCGVDETAATCDDPGAAGTPEKPHEVPAGERAATPLGNRNRRQPHSTTPRRGGTPLRRESVATNSAPAPRPSSVTRCSTPLGAGGRVMTGGRSTGTPTRFRAPSPVVFKSQSRSSPPNTQPPTTDVGGTPTREGTPAPTGKVLNVERWSRIVQAEAKGRFSTLVAERCLRSCVHVQAGEAKVRLDLCRQCEQVLHEIRETSRRTCPGARQRLDGSEPKPPVVVATQRTTAYPQSRAHRTDSPLAPGRRTERPSPVPVSDRPIPIVAVKRAVPVSTSSGSLSSTTSSVAAPALVRKDSLKASSIPTTATLSGSPMRRSSLVRLVSTPTPSAAATSKPNPAPNAGSSKFSVSAGVPLTTGALRNASPVVCPVKQTPSVPTSSVKRQSSPFRTAVAIPDVPYLPGQRHPVRAFR